nr:MAG TPA: hypothetical protein [Bacteriophage sp.]
MDVMVIIFLLVIVEYCKKVIFKSSQDIFIPLRYFSTKRCG